MEDINTSGFVVQPRLRFKNTKDKMLYQLIVSEANFVQSGACQIGQHLTSITTLEKETGWSYGVLRGMLKRLEDAGFIQIQTMSQNRGIKITVVGYQEFQKLDSYKKINKQDNKPVTNGEQTNNKQSESPNASGARVEAPSENPTNKPKTNDEQTNNKENNKTITAFITALNSINSNITLKEYLQSSNVKSMNLANPEELRTFVDFASQLNVLPSGVSDTIVFNYLDTIRLSRSTCTISANVVANLLEKISKYSVNQINYALWMHCEKHDDKQEKYTLGILRNTKEPEAIRGLMKLKNRGGAAHESNDANNAELESKLGF